MVTKYVKQPATDRVKDCYAIINEFDGFDEYDPRYVYFTDAVIEAKKLAQENHEDFFVVQIIGQATPPPQQKAGWKQWAA